MLPQQYRAWFKERGVDIDRYCVELTQGAHEAHHGAGYVKQWPEGAWNKAIMARLERAELGFGRKLKPKEILRIAREHMEKNGLDDLPFVPYKDPEPKKHKPRRSRRRE